MFIAFVTCVVCNFSVFVISEGSLYSPKINLDRTIPETQLDPIASNGHE